MSFLTYYGEEVPTLEPPRRVYARVDRREPPDGEFERDRVLLLDSLDADWFDEMRQRISWLGDPNIVDEADRRISVVEVPTGGGPPDIRSPEGAWMVLTFLEQGAIEVLHYLNLFAAPLTRTVTGWFPAPQEVQDELDQVTGLGDLPDASEAEIRQLLRGSAADAAAVYDVGHGNCAALLDGDIPSLYFDFGGGVLGNRKTFPPQLGHFCFSGDPLIVLSHWDYDHWSSAKRDIRALRCTWLVPRQNGVLGPTHATFLGDVHRHGRVVVWSGHPSSIAEGGLVMERCTGPRSSRNDSGIALVVEARSGRMLFPGDCGYDHVPSARQTFTSVVVPHHGGRAKSSFVVPSDGRPSGRLVYSYGRGNSYGHPFPQIEQLHSAAWRDDRRTEHRDSSGLGHVQLYWDPSDRDATPRCGGRQCDLTCHQR